MGDGERGKHRDRETKSDGYRERSTANKRPYQSRADIIIPSGYFRGCGSFEVCVHTLSLPRRARAAKPAPSSPVHVGRR